jgi:acyl-CoA hydrolase
VNATLEVDLLGQCASESLGSRFWSGSGGQADFARGAQYSEGGEGFVVLHSTTREGATRIVPQLRQGAVVTTLKNTVDNVVTEHGVAELRGCTIEQRARSLITVAAPEHREALAAEARSLGFLR